MQMLNNVETLNIQICGMKVKYIPVIMNVIFIIFGDLYFCIFFCSKVSKFASTFGAVVLCLINNIIAFLILLSLYRVCMTDAGSVPLELKIERSDVIVKHHARIKQIRDQVEAGVDPNSINYLSDEDDKQIENSQETENLEQEHEENGHREDGYASNLQSSSKSKEKIRLLSLSKFERSLIKFRYCQVCDNVQPPRSRHCEMCNKCILKFDHHCFYIANCVGYHNHKYFILLIFYTTLACTFDSLCFIYGWSQGWFDSPIKNLFSLADCFIQLSIFMTMNSLILLLMLTLVMMIKNTSVAEVKKLYEVIFFQTVCSILVLSTTLKWCWERTHGDGYSLMQKSKGNGME